MSNRDKERDNAALRRREHIAVAAYYNAERRGFQPNAELDDWLEAERQYDSRSGAHSVTSESSATEPGQESYPEAGQPQNLIAPEQVGAWSERLGVSAEELRNAIHRVGPAPGDVEQFLKSRSGKAKEKPKPAAGAVAKPTAAAARDATPVRRGAGAKEVNPAK